MQRDIQNQTQAIIAENAKTIQDVAGNLSRNQNSD